MHAPASHNPELLVLLSGGLDSAACVAFYSQLRRPLCALFIDYGQAAVVHEQAAARRIASHFHIPLIEAQWSSRTDKRDGLIQGRNAFLLSAALLERPDTVRSISIGIHASSTYSDCKAAFVTKMQALYDVYHGGRVEIVAPFLEWTKADIWNYARSSCLPIGSTYSCERGGTPCGQCLSCLDRDALYACS